jgi:hypothetical protein
MPYGQNIGMAEPAAIDLRSRDLTALFMTLLGTWKGEYRYFDERRDGYVECEGELRFTSAPMPNVIMLDARTMRPNGPPVHAFTAMVVQADGCSWRQMAFTPTDGRLQDKVITGFERRDEADWSVDMIEVQQGFGGVQAVAVQLAMASDRLEMRKSLLSRPADVSDHPYESRALFARAV